MPVFLAILIKVIFLFSLMLTFPKLSLATCTPTLFFRPKLIIAKSIDQQSIPQTNQSVYTFQKILGLKGKFNKNIIILVDTNPTKCSDCPPSIIFTPTKNYLISIDQNSSTKDYRISECDRIVSQVSGLYDPKLYLHLLRIITQPLWTSVFLIALLLSSWIDNFFPPVIALAISILLMLEFFGWSIILIIRRLRS